MWVYGKLRKTPLYVLHFAFAVESMRKIQPVFTSLFTIYTLWPFGLPPDTGGFLLLQRIEKTYDHLIFSVCRQTMHKLKSLLEAYCKL